MPNPGAELSSIDFASMIGGPLIAVVQAQAQSAIATVDFVKQFGFEQPANSGDLLPSEQTTGKPIYVKFRFQKDVPQLPGPDGTTPPPMKALHELEVPMLTMLPIPYLRIEETTIDFNAKINSVEYARTDSSVAVDASLEARAGWGWGSARLKVAAAYKSATTTGNSVERTYSLAVKVTARQDQDPPAGMGKLLSILENSITSTAVTTTP